MRGLLSSYRFRRRAFWTLLLGALLAAAVVGAIKLGNTGHKRNSLLDNRPVQVVKTPTHHRLTKADRSQLFAVSNTFVRLAVARPPVSKLPADVVKRLDVAWELLGPEMRAGQTRKSWDSGFNNVIPFTARGVEGWAIDYAYDNDVGVDMSLFAGRGSKWSGKTFTIELKRYPRRGNRWLVAAWVPKGVGGGGKLSPFHNAPLAAPESAKIATRWLLLPVGIVGGLLLVLGTWAAGRTVRHRRVARRYAQALGHTRRS